MSNIPEDLRYAGSHEWIREENGTVRVGISDNAQEQLGDLVFVEVPEVGAAFSAGDPCAVGGSVKAASDIYCPVSGEVVEVNELLEGSPETINDDPYGEGWLCMARAVDDRDRPRLMTGELARNWLDGIRRRIASLVWSPADAAAWDAGPLQPGYGVELTEAQFDDLKRSLLR